MKALCLLIVALIVTACSPSQTAAPTPTVVPPKVSPTAAAAKWNVVKVVDGDTITVISGTNTETVRVIGIDTPETVAPNQPIECFGKEASARAEQLLAGKSVTLSPDPTQDSRDQYGRMLAYVEVDGQDFGLLMIAGGYAHEYTYDKPYQRQAQYKSAQADARVKGLGLWSPSTCGGNTGPLAATAMPGTQTAGKGVPPASRNDCPTTHPIKGNITTTARIYHVPGGNSYEATVPEICFATTADAEADGFRAPRN